MKIVIALTFFLVTSSSALAEPWWQWGEEGWCFRLDARKTCLPGDYQALHITSDQIEFARTHPTEPARFVEYRPIPLRERTEVPHVPSSFLLMYEQTVKSAYIAKYMADVADPASHDMTVFVIVLNSMVTVMMYGSDEAALSSLARSVVEQWNCQ